MEQWDKIKEASVLPAANKNNVAVPETALASNTKVTFEQGNVNKKYSLVHITKMLDKYIS